MYPLPNNNFNAIALALMRDPLRVDSVRVGSPSRDIWNQNILYFRSSPADLSLKSTADYQHWRRLSDGRALKVRFTDTYFDGGEHFTQTLSCLEIRCEPSETNQRQFGIEEQCWTRLSQLAGYGGAYSWLAHLGEGNYLTHLILSDGGKIVSYSLNNLKNRMERSQQGHADAEWEDRIVVAEPELAELMSKRQALTSEVLAVLQGKSDTVTTS